MDTANDGGAPMALCRLDEIPEGEAIAVECADRDEPDGGTQSIIVWRQAGRVRAWLNICPHAGRRLDWAPGKFLISRDTLICAAHGASFRTDDGLCVGGPCRGAHLAAVPTTVEGGVVYTAA